MINVWAKIEEKMKLKILEKLIEMTVKKWHSVQKPTTKKVMTFWYISP